MDDREARTAVLKPLVGIRFIAVAATVFQHSGSAWLSTQPWTPRPLANMVLHFNMGLGFFFLLSGFILQTLYRGRMSGTGTWKRYGVSRVARIYPLYLLGVLVMIPAYGSFSWQALPQFLLIQCWPASVSNFNWQNWNPPAWMLSVECFFYLCFPFLCGVVERMPRRTLIGGIVVVAAFALVTGSSEPPGSVARFGWMNWMPWPVLRLPEFLAGLMVAEWQARRSIRPLPIPPELSLLLFAVVLGWSPFESQAWVAVVLATFVIIGLVNAPRAPFTRLMNTRVFMLLGGASYAMYIIHEPVNFALRTIGGRAFLPLQYPIDIVLAIALLLMFETPARHWINARFSPKEKPATVEEQATVSPASAVTF